MLTLMLLLTGCVERQIAIKCPQLSPAPRPVIDALERAGRGDEKAKKWVIDLYKHYQKLGMCK